MVTDSDPSEEPKKSMGFVVKKSVEKKPLWKMIRARPIFEENFVRLEDIIIVSK